MKSRQPMSSHATGCVVRANTGICVSGRGKPASCSHSRVVLSRGDSAPPSTQWEQLTELPIPACARIPIGKCEHRFDRELLVPHQRVQPCQRLRSVEVATDVECRTNPRRHRQPGQPRDLVVGDPLSSRNEPSCGRIFTPTSSIGTSGSTHGAPWSADAATPATTPLRFDASHAAIARSRSDRSASFGARTPRNDGRVPALELVPSYHTRRDGFTAENDLCHVRIVRAGTDIPVKSTFCGRSASRRLQNVDFAA